MGHLGNNSSPKANHRLDGANPWWRLPHSPMNCWNSVGCKSSSWTFPVSVSQGFHGSFGWNLEVATNCLSGISNSTWCGSSFIIEKHKAFPMPHPQDEQKFLSWPAESDHMHRKTSAKNVTACRSDECYNFCNQHTKWAKLNKGPKGIKES